MNSPLASLAMLSPHTKGKRSKPIDRITVHCVVGQCSAETLGVWFRQPEKRSCNYGVDKDGRIVVIVPEDEQSMCSSSSANDARAITIETATDTTSPYACTAAAWRSLVRLCVDICKRNGKTRLLWIADKTEALAYKPDGQEMQLTVHRWFAKTECPGSYIFNRLPELADEVTRQLTEVHMFNSIADVPSWATATIQKLLDRDIIRGTEQGLCLTPEMTRILVMLDRAGVFERD